MVTKELTTVSADGRWNVMAAACPTREVVDRIGSKWSLLALYALAAGTLRFTELKARVEGVSQKMLTQTLRGLERDGLISRRVHPTIPPKVEYSLTPLGESLSDVISAIRVWAYDHMDDIGAARDSYDATQAE